MVVRKLKEGGDVGELVCFFGDHSSELPIVKFMLGRFANFFVFLSRLPRLRVWTLKAAESDFIADRCRQLLGADHSDCRGTYQKFKEGERTLHVTKNV